MNDQPPDNFPSQILMERAEGLISEINQLRGKDVDMSYAENELEYHQEGVARVGDTCIPNTENLEVSMFKILNSIPLLYIVMLWPGRFAVQGLFDDSWYYAQMMYDSGLWAVWLLLVTPALLVINSIGYGIEIGRWLLHRRRHFGLVFV